VVVDIPKMQDQTWLSLILGPWKPYLSQYNITIAQIVLNPMGKIGFPRGLGWVIAKFGPAFWECLPPLGFNHGKAWGEHSCELKHAYIDHEV